MKLNPDCVRDVILLLEERLSIQRGPNGFSFLSMTAFSVAKALNGNRTVYTYEEIAYVLLQLSDDGYIVTSENKICNNTHHYFDPGYVLYLTPKGHNFAARLRNASGWEKTKKIAGAVGGISLSVIEAISSGVAGAIIDKMVGAN